MFHVFNGDRGSDQSRRSAAPNNQLLSHSPLHAIKTNPSTIERCHQSTSSEPVLPGKSISASARLQLPVGARREWGDASRTAHTWENRWESCNEELTYTWLWSGFHDDNWNNYQHFKELLFGEFFSYLSSCKRQTAEICFDRLLKFQVINKQKKEGILSRCLRSAASSPQGDSFISTPTNLRNHRLSACLTNSSHVLSSVFTTNMSTQHASFQLNKLSAEKLLTQECQSCNLLILANI